MAEMWKPHDIEVYRTWLNAILDEASDALNDWESSFVDSMQNRLDNGWNLSQNQSEKLEQIYTKHTK